MPSLIAASSKFRPAKLRAFVASRNPRYTQSAPWSIAALSAGRLPAGHSSSGGRRELTAGKADMDKYLSKQEATIRTLREQVLKADQRFAIVQGPGGSDPIRGLTPTEL